MLDYRSESTYVQARKRARWGSMMRRIRGKSDQMVDFAAFRERIHIDNQVDRGVQAVPLEKIVGSVSRTQDFDRNFMPTKNKTRERWLRIADAMHKNKTLPPIQVCKVDDLYFVMDGNHRVSVSKVMGVEFIDAHVIEMQTEFDIQNTVEVRRILE